MVSVQRDNRALGVVAGAGPKAECGQRSQKKKEWGSFGSMWWLDVEGVGGDYVHWYVVKDICSEFFVLCFISGSGI